MPSSISEVRDAWPVHGQNVNASTLLNEAHSQCGNRTGHHLRGVNYPTATYWAAYRINDMLPHENPVLSDSRFPLLTYSMHLSVDEKPPAIAMATERYAAVLPALCFPSLRACLLRYRHDSRLLSGPLNLHFRQLKTFLSE